LCMLISRDYLVNLYVETIEAIQIELLGMADDVRYICEIRL